jgi:transposase
LSSLTAVLNDYFRWTWHDETVTEHCPSARAKIRPRGNGTYRSHRLEARNRSPMPCHLNDLPALDARDHAFEVLLELTDRNIGGFPHV